MKSNLRYVFTVLALLVISCSGTFGQAVTGSIVGNITDAGGAAVAGAKITITETNTGIARNAVTNSEGGYVMPYLQPGTYKIEVEKTGFKKISASDIRLATGQSARVNLALEVGQITEVAEITSASPLLQTESAELTQSFEARKIQELPLNGRNFQSLLTLVPGVQPSNSQVGVFDNPQGTQFLQVNGQNNSANNFQIDGVDNNEPLLGLVVQIPPAEAIQQFSVSTSNYDAEFGRAVGAVVNVTTKPGSNQYHGSLFEFHNNSALKARNYFQLTGARNSDGKLKVPNAIRNQFGGTIGGPVIKNRMFFFGDYQGQYQRIGRVSAIQTVPTQAFRDGDFSALPAGTLIYDPGDLNNPVAPTARTPFAGNKIPANRISPVALNILKFIPLPNLPGVNNNYLAPSIPFQLDTHSFDVRVDHQFSDKTNFFAKYNYFQSRMADPGLFGDAAGPTATGDANSLESGKGRNQVVTLNLTRAFSATLTTEARFGFTRYFIDARGPGSSRDVSKDVGITGSNEAGPAHKGLAIIAIEGFPQIGMSTNMPTINADNIFNWINNWTKVSGSHTFKWGADIRRQRLDRLQIQGTSSFGPRGRFAFAPGVTLLQGGPTQQNTFANAFASFLIGQPDVVGRAIFTTTPTNRSTNLFFFGQDTWQASRKLTLNLGLRYEIYTPITSRLPAGQGNYDPETNNLLVAGVGDVSLSAGVKTDWNNLAPRVGFAYRFGDKDRNVLRGGFGISYFTARFGFTGGTLSTSFPVIADQQIGAAGDFRAAGSIANIPAFTPVPIPSNGIINPAPNIGLFAIPFENNMPTVLSYNLTAQREVLKDLSVELSYVGNRGYNQPYNRQLMVSQPGTGLAGVPLNQKFGRTATTTLRAYGVDSWYNALQTSVEKRFSKNIAFTAAYTWSRSIDFTSNNGGLGNPLILELNKAVSDFDRKHGFTLSHTIELPFGRGQKFLNKGLTAGVLGGWQLNGIFQAFSGRPFSVTMSNAQLNGGPSNAQRPDQLRYPTTLGAVGPGTQWFDVTAFAAPPATPARYGTAGRNTIRGPELVNYDFSVFKSFAITETKRIEFRTEFYNLTNTPHFNQPAGNFSTPASFGSITSTIGANGVAGGGEREVQFALRFLF
ncbi:MAG TPA: carboxypeptidase regulatory-like domain-containing protein [Blastocatellia bacterium]|nr:carboxypeptidase regulatory-like domain-containing protein [Blastocatellia bacterium]